MMKTYFARIKFSRLLCVLLALLMLVGTVMLTACNSDESADENKEDNNQATEKSTEGKKQETGEQDVNYVKLLRVVDDIAYGGKFTSDKVMTVTVEAEGLPEGLASDFEAIKGKYAACNLYAGDYILSSKVLDKKPVVDDGNEEIEKPEPVDPLELGYVVITSYSEYVESGDYSAAMKKAMEENPGSTIYFPDGSYVFSEPIVIPANSEKSVSIRMSNLAIIRPNIDWEDRTAPLIRVGVSEDENEDFSDVSVDDEYMATKGTVSITGGCVYGMSKSSGISIEGGAGTYLHNVSIKSTLYGIQIKQGPNALGATYANIDNVNITGDGTGEAIGVLVDGTYNTLSNMRIASIMYGVKCNETGSRNTFRNIHPLCSSTAQTTAGFWDLSDGNLYDVCYSDQFATGFLMESNTKSVYNGCFCFWYSKDNKYHVGFASNGQFNSIIESAKVTYSHEAPPVDAFLLVGEEGGQGVVLYPISGIRSKEYQHILETYLKT